MKLVTVGIPFFNNEKTLSYAIKSTITQTYENLEIILIDDGSTDSSLIIAKQFAAIDTRIKIVSDSLNKGLIRRLNQIIEIATGDYIARMDADDMMDRQRIEKQLNILIENSQVDVVTTGMVSLNNDFAPVGKRYCKIKSPCIYDVFRNGNGLLHASMLAKVTWWRKHRYLVGYDRAEDRELFTRTLHNSNYSILPEPLYYYKDIQNIDIAKFLKSYQSERKILFKNWKLGLNFKELVLLLFRSYLKSLAIRFYFLFGVQEKIMLGKNELLSDQELEHVVNEINFFTN